MEDDPLKNWMWKLPNVEKFNSKSEFQAAKVENCFVLIYDVKIDGEGRGRGEARGWPTWPRPSI
jgi:hypothetical protein